MPQADLQTPQPAEERSYLAFAATALGLALGVGLTLGILVALGRGSPRLIQAHGWTQLQGWVGLFVAGMGLRLMPRLAGRRPFPSALALSVLVLLTAGVVFRIVAQTAAAAAASALGALVLAAAIGWALTSRGRSWQPWRLAAWAGTVWWIGWAVLTALGGAEARDGLVPARLDDAAVWVALLGWTANFIWAVQSRSVPVFYGRRSPAAIAFAPPLVVLNAGVALVFASAFGLPVLGVGLGLAGAATIWLAPVAGSIGGTAHRLRPSSRPAARFIVAANLWAMVAGVLLLLAFVPGSDSLRDAALHAAGLGFVTTLILGMSQLLMPAFAGARIGRSRPGVESWLALPVLVVAAVLRVSGALLPGQAMPLIAASGALAWIALAAFAVGMMRSAAMTTQEQGKSL